MGWQWLKHFFWNGFQSKGWFSAHWAWNRKNSNVGVKGFSQNKSNGWWWWWWSSVPYSNLFDSCNWFHGFSHNPLQPWAAPTMPGGDLWVPNKSPRAACTTVKHVKETLEQLFLVFMHSFLSVFHSLSLFLSLTHPPRSPPPSSSYFIRGTEGEKRDSYPTEKRGRRKTVRAGRERVLVID